MSKSSNSGIGVLCPNCSQLITEYEEALKKRDDEIQRLNMHVITLVQGICIAGWWCMHCDSFNGEEKEKTNKCRRCERVKYARIRT